MKALLTVERIVLESISRGNTNIEAIAGDTNLVGGLLSNVLRHLLDHNILSYNFGAYSLNLENKKEWISILQSDENLKEEINELLKSHVNLYFEENKSDKLSLGLKKISLTSSEEKILQAHLINLNSFVQNIEMDQTRRKKSDKTYKKTVLFWGHAQYSKLIDRAIAAV